MIYFYVESGSYMGTTASGITFSSGGIVVNGVSGSSTNLASVSYSGNSSSIGDTTPLVLINTTTSPNSTNFTLPDTPANGTTIFIRRTDIADSGTTTIFASQFGNAVIRRRSFLSTSTNVTLGTSGSLSGYKCFFFNQGVWWEF